MTLVALVLASQIADALGYSLATQRGLAHLEANPVAIAIGNPAAVLAMKLIVTVVLVVGSSVLIRAGRQRAVAWLACVGFVGCLSELAVL